MADNVITPQESEVLAGNLDTINQLMAQIQALQAQVAMPQQQQQVQRQPVTPESLGIDRHRIMGIPVGPKLTLDESLPKSSPDSTVLNLSPAGTQDQVVAQEAQMLEEAADARGSAWAEVFRKRELEMARVKARAERSDVVYS